MAAVLFKDFYQNFVEEIKSLVPTEKKKIVEIFYRAVHEDFVVSISIDKGKFEYKINHFIATVIEKAKETYTEPWKFYPLMIEVCSDLPGDRIINIVFKVKRD